MNRKLWLRVIKAFVWALVLFMGMQPLLSKALLYSEILPPAGKVLGTAVYPTQTLVNNRSLVISITPLEYQNGKWNYQVAWNRTLDRQGSVYLSGTSVASPAVKTGAAQTGFVLNPKTAYKLEFYSQPDKKGVLLARKYFTTLDAPVVTPVIFTCPAAATNAFTACYYAGKNFETLKATSTVNSVNFDWGGGSPSSIVPVDQFSATYEGVFTFEAASYVFSATADDGVRVYVDGQLIIDKWINQAATTYTATSTLTAGNHTVKLAYYENGYYAVAKLSWAKAASQPALSPAPAPTPAPNPTPAPTSTSTPLNALCPAAKVSAFSVCYFNSVNLSNLVATATASAVNFEWGSGSPATGVNADGFSASLEGDFNFDAVSYSFSVTGDDGVRVFLDGQSIIDGWKNQSPTTYTATKSLTAGTHRLKVEYYESAGSATLKFSWLKTADVPPSPGNAFKTNATYSYPAPLRVFEVGPGKQYESFAQVPMATIQAGDMIRVYWRPEPYREKFDIGNSGTEAAPIVITGVYGPNGERPVIDGENAKEHPDLDYWNMERGIIKLSGSSMPGNKMVKYVVIENLEIRNARLGKSFIGKTGGSGLYESNAAAIYVEQAENLVIRNCDIHDNGNGIFIGSNMTHPTKNILIQGNYIHDNSYFGDGQHHNVYVQGINMVFEYNYMKLDRDYGNNIKDRSANLTVRYNWIEGGNRVIDAVNSGLMDIVTQQTGSYPVDNVYGNVFIKLNGYDNDQIIHWGGDTEYDKPQNWRKRVNIFNNTFIVKRTAQALGFWLDRAELQAKIYNNVIYFPTLAYYGFDILGGTTGAQAELKNNWVSKGDCSNPNGPGLLYCTRKVITGSNTQYIDAGGNVLGDNPIFADVANGNFKPLAGSPLLDKSTDTLGVSLDRQYLQHLIFENRSNSGLPDLGAYEK